MLRAHSGIDVHRLNPSAQLLAWLEDRIGPPGTAISGTDIAPPPIDPAPLPELGAESSTDAMDRLAHARGQGLADIIRVRAGLVPNLPDAVCRPERRSLRTGAMVQPDPGQISLRCLRMHSMR